LGFIGESAHPSFWVCDRCSSCHPQRTFIVLFIFEPGLAMDCRKTSISRSLKGVILTAINLTQTQIAQIKTHLSQLYSDEQCTTVFTRLENILEEHLRIAGEKPPPANPLSERDAILITYGDMVSQTGKKPLITLFKLLSNQLKGIVSGVHILPFFPYSSDDGFSVTDYRSVDSDLGDWPEITKIADSFRLMIDAVINHVSTQSDWFQKFLSGESVYRDYFIRLDPNTNLDDVVRPRDLPLLTPVKTSQGEQYVWTTFSADQIDLNFSNPDVLLEILDLLLFYVRQGAQIIRLDAIAFLWKQAGTSCIHLPQTHHVVKLIHSVLDAVAPWVYVITETNVPHTDNISYFGDGSDEAHMVYQFALPPLVLHTLLSGDASRLSDWAAGIRLPSKQVTFFNFLASHDGIGLRPVQGILAADEIEALIQQTKANGGGISYRQVNENEHQPYELNINYYDALIEQTANQPGSDRQVARFMVSQAIMLSLIGVPGIYFHSMFGSRNHLQGVEKTGKLRSINREKLKLAQLEDQLADHTSIRARVFHEYERLLHVRRRFPAFHPHGKQRVLEVDPSIFALIRSAPNSQSIMLCLHEVSGEPFCATINLPEYALPQAEDVLSGDIISLDNCPLDPYQVRWINLDGCVST
jgi:glycosidase